MTIPTSTSDIYSKPARWIHWTMALLIVPMLIAGYFMVQDGISRPLQNSLFIFHKNIGTLLLLLIVVRLFIRWRNTPPPEPSHLPVRQARIATITHVLLYALLVVVPLAGYVRVRAGGFPIEALDALGIPPLVPRSDALAGFAKSIHFYGGRAMGILVAMHIAAALFHAIIKRDGIFQRMLPSKGQRTI